MSRSQSLLFIVVTATTLTIACAPAPQPAEQSQTPAQTQRPSAPQPPTTPEQKIQNAMSAAPAGIAQNATIMDWPAAPGALMTELRKGSNGWTCMPDHPDNPVNDPMCMDPVAMQWADAWMNRKPLPNLPGMGIGYMLQGGATADNADPHAMQPKPGSDWIKEPPHIMLFGANIPPGAFPTVADVTAPWVMWAGTPYEHLMVPVK